MRKVHYFPQYSTKENQVTNNTLLLFSRLNSYSPALFEKVINSILGYNDDENTINVGAGFYQQGKGSGTIYDGVIKQSSFQILIETKLYDDFREDQLINYLSSFEENAEKKILLGLSKNKANQEIDSKISKEIEFKNLDIEFASTGFSDLIEIFEDCIDDRDFEMQDMILEFREYCEESNLIDLRDQTMLAVTTGMTLRENLQYGVYYDPAVKNHRLKFKYLALYNDKALKAIGEVKSIVECDLVDGKIIYKNNKQKKLNPDDEKRVKDIIEDTYYDVAKNHKFMVVDKFYETDYRKITSAPVRDKKYFDLKDKVENFSSNMTAKDIADYLNGKTWK